MDEIHALHDDFTVYFKSKESWHITARHLMGAAGTLWACKNEQRSTELVTELGLDTEFSMVHALRRPYLMLCGISLEVLFKAIVVAKGEKPNTKTHDLRTLASNAGVAFTAKQQGQLDLLSQYIAWAGRYPVPRPERAEHYQNLYKLERQHLFNTQKGDSIGVQILPGTQLDWEHFHKLWKRAEKIYYQHER
jgi:hypothetical protein